MRDINVAITGTLNAAAQTVTFNTAIDKNKLLTIVNTTANVEIYTANDATNGGTLDGTNTVLTLDYDTAAMSNGDLLQVIYEGAASTALSTAALQTALNTLVTTGNGTLASILAKIIAAPSTEAKQDDEIAALAAILAKLTADPSTGNNQTLELGELSSINVTLNALAAIDFALGAGKTIEDVVLAINAAPLPSGAATEAKQDTQITSEQAIQAALGAPSGAAVITDADGTIQQYLRGLIKQWIAGTLVLGAGANAIGKLAANSGVDIGDVDVTSVTPGSGATNLGKAEDAAHASGDVGVMALGVRNDTGATISSAEGDYTPLATDQYGYARVRGSATPTYMASTAQFTPGAAPTDIWTITGSASKTVRIVRLILSGTQTTAGNVGHVSLIKRSTANTGGTSAAPTLVPVDSGFAAASATVLHYTANPTTGTLVGTIWNTRVNIPAPASNVTGIILDLNLQDMLNGTGVVLRGTSQVLAINMGGTLPSGAANFQVTAIWTEE